MNLGLRTREEEIDAEIDNAYQAGRDLESVLSNDRIANAVRDAVAAERERCAALVESIAVSDSNSGNLYYAGPFRTHAARRIRDTPPQPSEHQMQD